MLYRKLAIILRFYRTFALFSNGVTGALIGIAAPYLTRYLPTFIAYLFWFKLFSSLGIWLIVRQTHKPQFWFYHNLGFSKAMLFGTAFALDGLITTGLILLTYSILTFL